MNHSLFSCKSLILRATKFVSRNEGLISIPITGYIENPKKNFHSNSKLRYDGQTAIVTGAGRGIGREYAMLLAARGANVVVNDLGGTRSGEGANEEASVASQVVNEIYKEAKGDKYGKAVANHDSVSNETSAQRIVDCALEHFGRVDILINNAGILRDKSFAKMNLDDWDQVCGVHLRGSFLISHACWPVMRKQRYGRIVMTSSTSGLYGNFGQANYAAAKMGLIGLSNTLAIEGRKSGIQCNTIVPMAASRMTSDILPEELASHLNPAYVAPLVAWLCHSKCQVSGGVFEAAGQWFGRYKLQRSRGKYLRGLCDQQDNSVELIEQFEDEISSFSGELTQVDSFADHLGDLMSKFDGK